MRDSLWVRLSRRARVRSAATDSAGVSSMKKGALLKVRLASTTRWKSSFESWPRRSFSDEMPVSSASNRVASCSADISSEKKPTTAPSTCFSAPSSSASTR